MEHLRTLDTLLERLEKAGIRLKRQKCEFMLPEIEYLGHLITADGLKPTAKKYELFETPRHLEMCSSYVRS